MEWDQKERKDQSLLFGSIMSAGVTTNSWRGVPLCEIYGSQTPWGSPEFPLVVPSYNHAVLYHVSSNGSLLTDRPPKPQIGQEKWDHDFVRMPCSLQSLYPVVNDNGESQLKKRWEIIENSLSNPIKNSQELADAILSYNTKFRNIWKFRALHKLFDEYLEEDESKYFFDVTLPEIVKLALALPKLIQAPIPLLKQHKNRSVSLSQQQIASLLANAFFCTFPRRNITKKTSEYASYPHINFNTLYGSMSDSTMEKLKCICHYFRTVSTKVPVGVLTFTRRSIPTADCPRWAQSEARISDLPLHVDSCGTIEDAEGLIQIDFANKYLGGGVLGQGCVQEEIRFVICPELMISMLFTEVLSSSEVLFMIGCERYSKYTGYGNSFQWAGGFEDTTPHDSSGRRRCVVLAMDALPYSNVVHEYKRVAITRELNKAWTGFSYGLEGNLHAQTVQYPGVATGNWGCGAFGGTETLKSLVQVMAAAHSRRPLAYYTFGDSRLRDSIINIYNMLTTHNVTVGKLYKIILNYCLTDVKKISLQTFLEQALQDGEKKNNSQMEQKSYLLDTKPECMDISSSSEISQQNVEEYFNDTNNSPDLFSQEESDLIEVKVDKVKSEVKETEVQTQTSRLFEEMQKLDCENGELSSLIKTNQNGIQIKNNRDSSATEVPETKKNKNKKITDYFSKML